MKKIVCMLFAILLVVALPIGVLAADEPVLAEDVKLSMLEDYWNIHGVDPLTDDLQQEISDAWFAKEGYALDWTYAPPTGLRYYGTYSECVVFMLPTESAEETSFEVAGWTFRHDSGFAIHVYRGGAFASLGDAYHQGWLTDRNILSICVKHVAYIMDVEYFGEYDGCHVAFINSGLYAYAATSTDVNVGGYTFHYSCLRELDVYKDGEFKRLSEAYKAGWLTDESVALLWNYYTNGLHEAPKTGDRILLPAVMLLFSGISLAVLTVHRKRVDA